MIAVGAVVGLAVASLALVPPKKPKSAKPALALSITTRYGKQTYDKATMCVSLKNDSKDSFYIYDGLIWDDCLTDEMLTWDGKSVMIRSLTHDFAELGIDGFRLLKPGDTWVSEAKWSRYIKDVVSGPVHLKMRFSYECVSPSRQGITVKLKKGWKTWDGVLWTKPVAITLTPGFVEVGSYADFVQH
jgi:hypothetical protein